MRCPSCDHENRDNAAFCDACGARLAAADAEVAQPLPSVAGGRYKAIRHLGEGGRKVVYLAHDETLDRDVALAVIKTTGLDEASTQRVQREARSMAKLGSHANVVTIHDVGEEDGQLFLISEFMAGGSVEDLLLASQGKGLPLAEVLGIAEQIAGALGYAHENGVIHRDLKPANVWLTADRTAKLGDFGLAAVAQDSKITSEGMMLGTVAYMSPEQAAGKTADARSDLYSFGAMLYEMATGRPPFPGDDVVAIISQHLNTVPVSPSWHNPEIPAAFDELIMQLLAKDVESRPQSAEEVRERIKALRSHTSLMTERVVLDDVNPLERLAAGIFVGRGRETDELREMFDAAARGSGRLGLLVGEPGIGKTRTAEELMTYARLRGAQTLVGRCYEGEGAPAYWPWIQVIRSQVHDRPAEVLISELGSGAGHIAQIVSEVSQALPNLQKPAVTDPEAARFQLFDSITTFLRNVARRRPLVVLLDDLHWADKPSLLLLEFLSRQLSESKLFILGTYRDVELGRQHPLAQTIASVIREPNAQRILLRGLTEADVGRYIQLTAGMEPAPKLVKAIYAETEGNPFFMSETVRLLTSEGRLEAGGTASWSVTIPQGVKEVIGRRLDQLSEECNKALSIASVIGREFDLTALEMLGEFSNERLLEVLEEATQARVISEVGGVAARYRFAHALIRETLYEELSTARRLRLHRSAGEAIEKLRAEDQERHLSEMAYHFFEAASLGDADKAVSYARLAGERAMMLLAYEEAVIQLDRALQALELKEQSDEVMHCELLISLGKAQTSAGEAEAARKTFDLAIKSARKSGSPELLARAGLGSGEVWVMAGYTNKDLLAVLDEALAGLPEGDSALKVRLLARSAEANKFDLLTKQREIDLSTQAIEMARRLDDPFSLAQALYSRIIALGTPERLNLSVELASELIEAAERAGDLERQLLGLRIRAGNLFELGDIEGARSDLDVYSTLAEKAKLPLYTWFTHLFRSTFSLAEGRLQEADDLLQRAYEEGRKAGDQNLERFISGPLIALRFEQMDISSLDEMATEMENMSGVFSWIWGTVIFLHYVRGNLDRAQKTIRELVSQDFGSVQQEWGWVWMLGLLAEVTRHLKDRASAEAVYALLSPYGSRFGVPGFMSSTNGCGFLHLGMLATTMGRYDEAEHHLARAREIHAKDGFAYLVAQTDLAHADLLAERGGPGDRERALKLVGGLIEIATELGLPRTLQRAVDLRLSLQGIGDIDATRSIHVIAAEVQEEKPELNTSPDGTVTILFTDLEGSTELNERLGDETWLQVLAGHDALVRSEVARGGGTVVKSNGDGYMLAFPSARQALRSAVGIQREQDGRNQGSAHPLRVRIGIHTGEVLRQSGDFFGRHVAFASRIADKATGGEILISDLTKALVAGSPEFEFGEVRSAELKGFPGEHSMSLLSWRSN